jgi:hypothetical protein
MEKRQKQLTAGPGHRAPQVLLRSDFAVAVTALPHATPNELKARLNTCTQINTLNEKKEAPRRFNKRVGGKYERAGAVV